MKKRKVVYFNSDCFTDTDTTVLRHLAKYYNVVWYYIHESQKANKMSVEDAQFYSDKYGIRLNAVDPQARNRSLKNLSFYWHIADEINHLRPDLVYHCLRNPYWAICIKYKLKCPNIVLGIHDVKSHSYSFSLSHIMERITKDIVLKTHKRFITFSYNQKELFRKEYGKESAMVGMSYKYFGASSLTQPDIDNGIKLLFFGSINKYKGLDLLISALEKLKIEGLSNLKLTIAGRGIFWTECKRLTKTAEMYNLQIRFIDNKEIPDLMSSHHFLVLPYRDATQSGPLATAVAYQLPIIAPDYGCFVETYSQDAAVFYKPGHLEEALRKVASLSQNDYSSLKTACLKVKENNDEENVARNYINYFDGLMDNM